MEAADSPAANTEVGGKEPPAQGGVTRDATQSAGRGLLSISAAKVYFIITSYAIQLVLPRLLKTPEAFGLFSTAMNVASIVNNVLIVATVQSVSKFVSEDEPRAMATLRRGLTIQLCVGGLLASVFLLGAGPLSHTLLDAKLEPFLRIAAVVVMTYSLYAALVGSLNGRRMFQRQATLDMSFSTLRTCGILGAAALGYGALGAMSGFAVAAVCVLTIGLLWVGTGTPARDAVPVSRWLAFTAPLWLYHGFLNGTMQIDLAVLKRTVAELALTAGFTAEAAATRASEAVGLYRAAQMFAFVPFQLILSLTFIIFPMVSKAIADGDHEATRRYIRAAMRFSILFLASVTAPIAGASNGVMRLAFPEEYVVASGALSILVVAMAAFALFVIASTILTSAGKPGLAAAVGGTSLAVVIVGNLVLVRAAGLHGDMLRAAALGTSIGTAVALIGSTSIVYLRFRALVAPATVLRSLVASVAAYFAAHAVAGAHPGRVIALVALAAGFAVFLAVLAATRELGKEDFALVRRVLKR